MVRAGSDIAACKKGAANSAHPKGLQIVGEPPSRGLRCVIIARKPRVPIGPWRVAAPLSSNWRANNATCLVLLKASGRSQRAKLGL
jgi:hypothetical protein